MIQASPYLRLITWISMAQISPDFRRSPFSKLVNSITETIVRHKRLCAGLAPGKPLEDVLAGELKKNDAMCMVLLWLLADPARYTPKPTYRFTTWPMPTTILEFDHRGCFKQISRRHFYYEGGESKASFKAGNTLQTQFMTIVGKAREQLLRRFSLIDVIARSAYRVQVYYTRIVYVPRIPDEAVTEFRIALPWAIPGEDNQGHIQSDPDREILTGELTEPIPDKATAIIRVSTAPGCLEGSER
jgi:hypothetical protein